MPQHSISTSDHSKAEKVCKRVCKACDRCRLKKSKCDGLSPCSRCRADDAVCLFGQRKKTHEKVYPKGYAEMLEQQQAWLVHGLREFYRRITTGEAWPGDLLEPESNGHPLTHDLLARLGALNHSMGDRFEENPDYLLFQDSSKKQSEIILPSSLPSDAIFQHSMPPTPPTYYTSPSTPMTEPESQNFQYGSTAPYFFSSLAYQDRQQCPINGINLFDDMNMMVTEDYTNMFLDGQIPSEDFNLFVDPDPMEITPT
ncbi:uncharacterized protein N7503_004296 [Penicillium pulvis]|uniref:uncharacterized protein n=1 Tax=Penicillium pulvis TaxID=1562058 RepID=UPI0025493D83|nr:uncharacterized protein N7503_004296 [Penicillium pulvis]KAJ5801846.1 hypothetical protein N7503_004296 [Penicillium pulvis]